MAIQQAPIKREFHYNSIIWQDPMPGKSPDDVRRFFARMNYAELETSVVEGPVTRDGVAVYKFIRAAGSKGVGQAEALERIVRNQQPLPGNPLQGVSPRKLKEHRKCSTIVATVVNNRHASTPLQPAAASFSIHG